MLAELEVKVTSLETRKKCFLGVLGAVAVAMIVTACTSESDVETGEDLIVAGKRLTPAEVADHVRAAGFAEKSVGKMVCIAKYESSYYTRAQNGIYRGLFQIGTLHLGRKGCPAQAEGLYDPALNAKCAKTVFDAQGIGAWSAYGSHKTECDKFVAPAAKDAGVASKDASTTTAKDASPTRDAAKDAGAVGTAEAGDDASAPEAQDRSTPGDDDSNDSNDSNDPSSSSDSSEDKGDEDNPETKPSAKKTAEAGCSTVMTSPSSFSSARSTTALMVLVGGCLVVVTRRRRRQQARDA
jgi:hypothetical protein